MSVLVTKAIHLVKQLYEILIYILKPVFEDTI